MAPQSGAQPIRTPGSDGPDTDAPDRHEETAAGPPDDHDPPEAAPQTADIYRTLFNELRRAFGGAIDDANADAIAYAASELYHKDVEPRLWEHKTAHEILDGFGVPRSGAFTRYSLSDRLLLLRRSADPGRAEHAHDVLTELGAPVSDDAGSRLSLKDRLAWLLDGTGPAPAVPAGAGGHDDPPTNPGDDTGEGDPPGGAGDVDAGDPIEDVDTGDPIEDVDAAAAGGDRPGGPAVTDDAGADDAGDAGDAGGTRNGAPPEPQRVIEALEAIHDAAPASGEGNGPALAAPTELPAAELIGLGTVIAGIQEELIRLRQAVETVEGRLDEVLMLLRTGTAGTVPPEVVTAGTPAESSDAPPVAPAPEDVTQVVPAVPDGIPLDDVPVPGPVRKRRRTLPKLILIAVVLGLLIAGVAITISVVGWSELRSRLRIGSVVLAASTVAAHVGSPAGRRAMTGVSGGRGAG